MYTGSATNGDFISMSGSAQGIVIEGLDFNSVFSNNGDEQAIPSAISVTGNDINISGNTFYNVEDDLDISLGATNVLVQNNNSPDPTALNAYFAFVGGSDLAFIGNTVASSVGEADFRSYANDVLIADNNWTRLAVANTGGKNVVSIRGRQLLLPLQQHLRRRPGHGRTARYAGSRSQHGGQTTSYTTPTWSTTARSCLNQAWIT